jgi:outer membrane protein assembly factor BamB
VTTRVGRAAAATVLATGLTAGLGGCWFAPGQGPDRQANNPFETGITAATVASLEPAWTADTGDAIVGPPVVSPAGVHVAASTTVSSFDKATGEPTWVRGPGGVPSVGDVSEPIVVGDEVVIGIGYPNIGGNWSSLALDAADGSERSLPPDALIDGVRGTTAGVSYGAFGSGGPAAHAVGVSDLVSGAGWTGFVAFGSFGSVGAQAPVTIGADGLFHAGNGPLAPAVGAPLGNGVRRFSLTTPANCNPSGSTPLFPCPTWATATDGVATSPVLGEGRVYTATSAGTVYALDAATGAVAWTAAVGSAVEAPPALADGTLFVPTTGGDLVALDAADGSVRFRGATGAAQRVQPAVAADVVVTGSDDGTLHAWDTGGCGPATCPSLWSTDTGTDAVTGAPAVSGGRLYVGTADGRLLAYTPQ